MPEETSARSFLLAPFPGGSVLHFVYRNRQGLCGSEIDRGALAWDPWTDVGGRLAGGRCERCDRLAKRLPWEAFSLVVIAQVKVSRLAGIAVPGIAELGMVIVAPPARDLTLAEREVLEAALERAVIEKIEAAEADPEDYAEKLAALEQWKACMRCDLCKKLELVPDSGCDLCRISPEKN